MLAKTKVAAPLSRKAVLVAVNISQWTARKLDRKVTNEVNASHGASADAGRYNKLLIEAERLAKLNGYVSEARTMHYKYTKPWADEGPRILPNVLFSEFSTKFREIKRDFATEADKFARDYPSFIEERKKALNGLFDPKDYPSAAEIRSKFNLDLTILPFPDASDFRADIDDVTAEEIRAEIATAATKSEDMLWHSTVDQVIDVVGKMAEKLTETRKDDEGNLKPGIFRDSLVSNVRELSKLLPAFNLTDDPRLTKIAKRIEQDLCAEEPATLRDNKNVRASVAQSAAEILADVEKFIA